MKIGNYIREAGIWLKCSVNSSETGVASRTSRLTSSGVLPSNRHSSDAFGQYARMFDTNSEMLVSSASTSQLITPQRPSATAVSRSALSTEVSCSPSSASGLGLTTKIASLPNSLIQILYLLLGYTVKTKKEYL